MYIAIYQLVVYDPLGDSGGPTTCGTYSTTQLENVKNNVAPASVVNHDHACR